ncbi:hypothetical protein H4J02_04600 [Protaetiibacter sp. SSC-01]|uniref:DUF6993 domain-containing protein n=1 Tax=Protaetiibacter sp. SSC-01 TaxID=2759943 RepID=UPI001656E953|nr:hypothetical protein [Protaetiibacter sp. SSC-01]QNO38306.1 hypothetical protein H4J02_04600 [Protaetiibacter sp. SSC-01]
MTRPRRALACAAAALVLVALAGCGTAEPMPTPTPTSSASASAEPTPTPEPTLVLDGTAEENRLYFDQVNQQLIQSGAALSGRAFADNLIAHGYPRENMEVTPDRTAINEPADNVVFSVRFGDTCLLGQWGNIGYTSLVTDVLASGRCLLGTARPA